MESHFVERPHYIEWLKRWRDKDVIKVVTGMRRSGKSTILRQFQSLILQDSEDTSNVIAINFESLDVDYPTEAASLYKYIVSRLEPNVRNYVFLDEVQYVAHFEKAVDALYIRDDVDLYLTGSNANLLSSQTATLLTGRFVELQMFPFSFSEYLAAQPQGMDHEREFNRYLTYGGLPYSTQLTSDQDIADYLGGVFNTILVQDIAARVPRMDTTAFRDVAAFLADNIGNSSSLQKISGALKHSGRRTSATTIGNYIEALTQNYLIFAARRYDLRGREYLQTEQKYYLGDLGFRFWFLGKQQGDLGHRLENVVYLELLRRFHRVDIGRSGTQEIDFVARDDAGVSYFQVSQTVTDPSVLKRELGAFKAIKDNRPKTLLTLDRVGTGDYEGIAHLNVIDWLLSE